MEPDDIPVHDLLGVGDEAAPGPDPLRTIVARAGRRRMRMAAAGMAVTLAAGAAIGYAVSNHSSSPAQTATGPAAASNRTAGAPDVAGAPSPAGAVASGSGGVAVFPQMAPTHFTPLLTRTTGGVAIRAFLTNFPQPAGVSTSCFLGGPRLQVEVSTAKMVGIASGGLAGLDRTRPLSGVQSQLIGTLEGDPTAVVTVATGTNVTQVVASFTGGRTDKMTPVQGWAVLAGSVPAAEGKGLTPEKTLGTLTARNAAGQVVRSQPLTLGYQLPAAGARCGPPVCPSLRPRPASPATPGAATKAQIAPTVACPPVPCGTPPRISASPPAGSPPVVNPGGPMIPASGSGTVSSGGVGYACPLHPAGAVTGSGSSTGSSAGSSTGSAGVAP